jgi:hypothetical protein
MNKSLIAYGLACFVVGIVIGVLVTLYMIPTTPKYQDAQAALIMAQAQVKEAEAERLRLEARADEQALAQTVQARVISTWVNIIVVPLAAVVVAVATFVWVNRKPVEPAATPSGMLPQMALDHPPVVPGSIRKAMVYVHSNNNDRVKRDLQDVREFIELGAVRGFARSTWVGKDFHFKTGHECTRTRYEELRQVCVDANVLAEEGGTFKLRCSVADALDCFSDGERDEPEVRDGMGQAG